MFTMKTVSIIWASLRQNLSPGFQTKCDSNFSNSWKIEVSPAASLDILSKKQITKSLISLYVSLGWSAPLLLFANMEDTFSNVESLMIYVTQCQKTCLAQSGFIHVREMSGKFNLFQGQGIVREFYVVSGKNGYLLKCQGNVREFYNFQFASNETLC